MSRRPRLVHEGSPIVDDPNVDGLFSHQEHPRRTSDTNETKDNVPKQFKLQTRLTIGGPAPNRETADDDSFDAMMTDHDEHDDVFNEQSIHHQQQNSHFAYAQPTRQQIVSQPNEYQPFQQQQNTKSHIHPMSPTLSTPLVVIDGANLAYHYAESCNPSLSNHQHKLEPNPRGITIAIKYFLQHQCRVQAVVPISWYKLKPRPGDHACVKGFKGNLNQRDDAKMITEEVEELRMLRQHGFLVACPPRDDDDAYALALARREEARLSNYPSVVQHTNPQNDNMIMDDGTNSYCLPMGGYIVSNDFFQDAVRRDEVIQKEHVHSSEQHRQHATKKHALKDWLKMNRISYTFANVGRVSCVGDVELEFLPNPRNKLIEAIDAHNGLH